MGMITFYAMCCKTREWIRNPHITAEGTGTEGRQMTPLNCPYSFTPGSAIQPQASLNARATKFPPGIQNVLNQEHLPDTVSRDGNFIRITDCCCKFLYFCDYFLEKTRKT